MKQNLKYLIVIVLTVLVVTYSYSLGPLIKKIDQPDQADAILQVITTIVGGILSGLVAYGIAFIEIKNYKKEQLIEKQEITISEAKKNIDRMKRLLVEIEDNKDACQQLNLLEDELESNILVIKLSVSDFFWKLSSNDIIASEDLLVQLNMYYKNIFIIQTTDNKYLNIKTVELFIENQNEAIECLSSEIEKEEKKLSLLTNDKLY
ncbi:TPA: hypothetical protein U2L08_000192 [Enterococcus faecium]|uniref:Uncharacterized protein n=1 Tax=Enterococcus casseliflavus EC20 TaxID=565655 RepID=C9AA46_ENTCA|nr:MULTISPECIES: hypothetical protein [Enterococcus]EEV39357.1 hypothetical protein ECBG_01626 [Enterococcus casseliflavus EC20]EFF27814.1 hypothetical protein EfmE1679_0081 [Enterococcus faecium E1679]EGP0010817.1 hypothetical protein [Enterococcus faecium]EGP4733774.1 hypothetical protein [Enterococcus faecium]EGP4914624.1 hypothetical protein [Enterococcus faecium]